MPLNERRLATRSIDLVNLHTGERIETTYMRDGRIDEAGMAALSRVLRDHRTGDVFPIVPEVIDIVRTIQNAVGDDGVVEIISGYRSPRTNSMLRAGGNGGVARRSLHMDGRAIDFRLPGTALSRVRQAGLDLKRGGVGYYPRSNFVHVDNGRVRFW